MRHRKSLYTCASTVIILFFGVVLAILLENIIQTQPPPLNTDEMTLLFTDDFNDPSAGWTTVDENGYYAGSTASGQFRLSTPAAEKSIHALLSRDHRDVSLQVSAINNGGEENNYFGLICRAISDIDYYAFVISSDGYYALLKSEENGENFLPDGEFRHTNLIKTDQYNEIQADCIGNYLSLSVNNTVLIDVDIPQADVRSGDVGLIAASFEGGGVDILFDDFAIYDPVK